MNEEEIIELLARGEGSVGAFATTYSGFYVDAYRADVRATDEELLRHVVLIYGTARHAIGHSDINIEQLVNESYGCLAKLIFSLLCQDADKLEVFRSGTEIANLSIEIIFECVMEAADGGVNTPNKTAFFHWAKEYVCSKNQAVEQLEYPPKKNKLNLGNKEALKAYIKDLQNDNNC